MAANTPGPMSQALAGAGIGSLNPYVIGGSLAMGLLQHRLNRGERQRQQRIQQAMARWSPYNERLSGGLEAAMKTRAQAHDAFDRIAAGQQNWDNLLKRSQQGADQTVQQTVGQMASPDQIGVGSAGRLPAHTNLLTRGAVL